MSITQIAVMREAVEDELKAVIQAEISDRFPVLREMISYHLGWTGEGAGPDAQGKRLRPLLVLLCAGASGGDWRQALPAAAAVELLHNFSLIHDDIQDESVLRRGRPTVWVKWGIAQAINTGDVMYTLAYAALRRLSETHAPDLVLKATKVLEETCLRLTEGQFLDISYEKLERLSAEQYWPMVGGKTAALLGACARLGALTACADEAGQSQFQHFGYTLGLAFQVQDDYLGLWGDAALTGKSAESDLVSGKKTLPVLFGLSHQSYFARRWQAGPISPAEAAQVAALLAQEGGKDYTLAEAGRLTHQALEALHQAGKDPQATAALESLAQNLLGRQS